MVYAVVPGGGRAGITAERGVTRAPRAAATAAVSSVDPSSTRINSSSADIEALRAGRDSTSSRALLNAGTMIDRHVELVDMARPMAMVIRCYYPKGNDRRTKSGHSKRSRQHG